MLALCAAACSPLSGGVASPQASPQLAEAGLAASDDVGAPLHVAWVDNDRLVVERILPTNTSPGMPHDLVWFDLATRTLTPIAVPEPPECIAIMARAPQLIDGELYFERYCEGENYDELMHLPGDGRAPESLARVPWQWPSAFGRLPSGAWLADFGGLCKGIDLVPGTGDTADSWPITITDDGPAYSVNAAGHASDCDGSTPIAQGLAEAPDGTLALLATGGPGGFSFPYVPMHLYLVIPHEQPKRIADGVSDGSNLRWRPDGKALAMIAEVDRRQGIWEFSLDGSSRLLYEGLPVSFDWSPDGTRLAVILRDDPSTSHSVSRVFIVSGLD
jgi:hypothetical protein